MLERQRIKDLIKTYEQNNCTGVYELFNDQLGTRNNKQDEANIKKRVDALNEMSAKNYMAVADFMYPKIFEHTSKQQMFQVFQLLEQAGIELKFNNLELLETNALPKENDVRYLLIKYKMDMELPLTTDDLKGMAGFMMPTLESNFGKGNVEYNQKRKLHQGKRRKISTRRRRSKI